MTIEILNLQKDYGSFVAVSDMDLYVAEGEMLVLLGPSGCGKTTTMRCIAGLEVPTRGTIRIGGREVYSAENNVLVPVNQRQVGMVFQSYAIWPHLTVYQNVAFPLKMAKKSQEETKKRVGEILELVGLGDLSDRGASYLSGGQMQRVALARSLAMQPSVLLFDEPLSNLDARLRDHLRVQLRELQTQLKITSVYVTHDQREALAIADKIMVMDRGKALQTADPITLYNNPRNRTVAAFLGYSNIFDAEIENQNDAGIIVRFDATGQKLLASLAPEEDTGRKVSACVRPEDIGIGLGVPQPVANINTLEGKVLLASFMGNQMQYRVRTQDGTIWEVLSSVIVREIVIGSDVHLNIPRASVKLLPSV